MRPAFRHGTIVASMLLLGIVPASAEMRVYYHMGSWDAFSGPGDDGKLVCGIGDTNPADNRSFSLRFQIGSDSVLFQAKKPTWSIAAGTPTPIVMQIGTETPWGLQAVGNGQLVQWTLDRNTIQQFDAQFRRGVSMTLTFPSGNEPPWTLGLNGSTAISNAFGRCITDLTQQAGLNATPGQPVTQTPSQPVLSGAPMSPTSPVAQTSGQPAVTAAPPPVQSNTTDDLPPLPPLLDPSTQPNAPPH